MKNNTILSGVTGEMAEEPFQVILKLPETPFLTRLTYTNKGSKARITEIEELSMDETQVIHSCRFKGKSKEGDGCDWLGELRTLANQVRPTDWIQNKTIFVDEFYKTH